MCWSSSIAWRSFSGGLKRSLGVKSLRVGLCPLWQNISSRFFLRAYCLSVCLSVICLPTCLSLHPSLCLSVYLCSWRDGSATVFQRNRFLSQYSYGDSQPFVTLFQGNTMPSSGFCVHTASQVWSSSSAAGLKCNQKVIGYSNDMHTTIASWVYITNQVVIDTQSLTGSGSRLAASKWYFCVCLPFTPLLWLQAHVQLLPAF